MTVLKFKNVSAVSLPQKRNIITPPGQTVNVYMKERLMV